MADISITPANVVRGGTSADVVNRAYNAGATVTAGQAVYLDTAASPMAWKLAQCDGTSIESGYGDGVEFGIALHAASSGQPLAVQTDGTITIGGTVVATTEYVVSATAGGICPAADLASTNKYTRIGYGTTTAIIAIHKRASNVAKA